MKRTLIERPDFANVKPENWVTDYKITARLRPNRTDISHNGNITAKNNKKKSSELCARK